MLRFTLSGNISMDNHQWRLSQAYSYAFHISIHISITLITYLSHILCLLHVNLFRYIFYVFGISFIYTFIVFLFLCFTYPILIMFISFHVRILCMYHIHSYLIYFHINYLILSCTFIYNLILFIYDTFVCFHMILFMYYIFLCFPYTILFIYLSLLSTFCTLLVHILFVFYTLYFLYTIFMYCFHIPIFMYCSFPRVLYGNMPNKKKNKIKLQFRQKNFPNYSLMPAMRTAGFDSGRSRRRERRHLD